MYFLKRFLPGLGLTLLASAFPYCAMAQEYEEQVTEVEQGQPAVPEVQQRIRDVLHADPKTIMEIRRDIQSHSAARVAPIIQDFDSEISQDVLDMEELFEISQKPDQPVPKIFVARYQSTAVSFVDAYGKPWPIRKVTSYLKDLIQIDKATTAQQRQETGQESEQVQQMPNPELQDPQAGSFTVTALKNGVVGNISIFLYNSPRPVTINLVGKSGIYHRTATVRLDDVGPQTDVSQLHKNDGVTLGAKADPDLNNALYGVSPLGSEEMVVTGVEGKAWLKGEFLYLMTPVSIFSPKIVGASHSNGKYRAYKLPKTTQAVGTNTDGKTVYLKIARHPGTVALQESAFGSGATK